jgi:hypothetical protein
VAASGTLLDMNKDDHLEQHLELCKRIYLRMLADGSWPWAGEPDSQIPEDLLELEDKNDDI